MKCRTPNSPMPVETGNYKLDGILNQDHAYQIGIRRLMEYLHQRLGYNTTIELGALVYEYGDRILLTDNIPGSKTVGCLVVNMATTGIETIFTVPEQLNWTFENPRAILRYRDDSASGLLETAFVGDYQLSVPWQAAFGEVILNGSNIEPPRLVFCSSTRGTYGAIFEETAPRADRTCRVTTRQYSDIYYQYDGTTYPGDAA